MFLTNTKRIFLILGSIVFGFLLTTKAEAQDVLETKFRPPANMRPGIRYTTGAITHIGWEQSLVERNPNLRRWNWSAITDYTQSMYVKVPPGAFQKQKNKNNTVALKPAGSIYNNPRKISTPVRTPGHVYDRPVHVPLPQRTYDFSGPVVVSNMTTNTNLAGNVIIPKKKSKSIQPNVASPAAPVVAKTYGIDYGTVSGRLKTPTDSTLASRHVFGKLVKAQ